MRAAAANWLIRPIALEVEFFHHMEEFAEAAAQQNATLLVLPELIDLEMLAIRPDLEGRAQAEWLSGFQADVQEEAVHLASKHNLTLVCGSTFALDDGQLFNRSWMMSPGGDASFQDKMVMTQFELDDWQVAPGRQLNQMPDSHLGIAVCYDSEFPQGVLAQAERGVMALCVPAYTETWHGFHRVRHCCLARATECQIFVIQASLVGSLGREPVPEAHGSAAVMAPSVSPFPPEGILAETDRDREGIAVADLNFEALLQSRQSGDVRNWEDRGKGNWVYDQT